MTTAFYDGNEIELAKYTLAIAEKFEKAPREQNVRVRAEKMYDVLKEVVGADTLSEIVDGKSYDTCDITLLVDLYNTVDGAYADDMNRHKNEKVKQQMEMVSEMGGKLERFTDAANRVNQKK